MGLFPWHRSCFWQSEESPSGIFAFGCEYCEVWVLLNAHFLLILREIKKNAAILIHSIFFTKYHHRYSVKNKGSSAAPVFPVEKERHFGSGRKLNTPLLNHYSTVQYTNPAPAVQPSCAIWSSFGDRKFHCMHICVCVYVYVCRYICVHVCACVCVHVQPHK